MSEDAYRAPRGRQGNRWYNARPEPEDVAAWFRDNVRLHEGMDHVDYVSGVTLIQSTERSKEVVAWREEREPVLGDVQNVVYTPYPRVDSRVAYWWRYLDLHPQWVGAIEPLQPDVDERATGLPPGFFKLGIPNQDGKEAAFIGCGMRVRIISRESGKDVHIFPPGTKVVSVLNRYGVDENAVMKAETGAIGRALGVAGMLVIPGSGVATAEDMHDLQNPTGVGATPPAGPALPPEPIGGELRTMLKGLVEQLSGTDQREPFHEWWQERGFGGMKDITDEQAKLAARQAERLLQRAVTLEGANAAG